MSPAIVVVQGCCQTIVAQSGTHSQFPRRTQRQPGSFYEHRFPLSCRTYFLLAGSGERAAVTLTRLAGYRRSPRGKQRRPIIRSNTHAPDQTGSQLRLLHWVFDLAAPGRYDLTPERFSSGFAGLAALIGQGRVSGRLGPPAKSLGG